MNDDVMMLARRVRILEQKIDMIMENLGIEFDVNSMDSTANVSPTVIDLVRRGKQIEAIKEYRVDAGVGLKEAKDVIDELMARVKSGML
jgi:ribosomal protein L7/L12